jgi:cytochrome c
MRSFRWTPFLGTLSLLAVLGLMTAVGSGRLLAEDDDDDAGGDLVAERERVAKEALEKAVARGKEIWNDKAQIGGKKSCAQCHDNPDKPKDALKNRVVAYPAYSRRKRGVVTLDQKINEMIETQGKGKRLDADSPDMAALAAYVMSIAKPK